jgi:hypothetical protein
MFESCRPDSRKLLGNKGLSAFLGQGAGRVEKRWGNSGAPETFGPALQHARWGTAFAPLVAAVHHRRSEGPANVGQRSEV